MKNSPLLRITSMLLALMTLLNMGVSSHAFLIAVAGVEQTAERALSVSGDDWRVEVTVDPAENWPADLSVRAEEEEDTLLLLKQTGIPERSLMFGRFFNIGLYSGEEEIQPEGRSVTVEILLPELDSVPEDVEIRVVHFKREPAGEAPVRPMLSASADGLQSMASAMAEDEPSDGAAERIDCELTERGGRAAVTFEADGFSVYGVLGTTIKRPCWPATGRTTKSA